MDTRLKTLRKYAGKVLRKFGYKSDTTNKANTANNASTTNSSDIDAQQLNELEEAKTRYSSFDRDHIWAFIAGQASQDFRGNPKYLFVYINRYRPDIAAYWLCSDEDTIAQVRSLGFTAHQLETPAAQFAIDHTGVLVTEQVKYTMPEGFENVKYLNLWHGVGFKHVERKMLLGDNSMELAQKYVWRGTFYRDHQLMVATSPTFVKEYSEDCGVDTDKFVRTGYLRCEYQQNFEPVCSYEHDLRKVKGLPESTKMIVYAPTYRQKLGGTFARAIPDFEALYECCKRNNLLLIFKVHPKMEDEVGFLQASEAYGDRPHFWFWDNRDDFYEIMDQMDMAIIDYSGIFSDMAAVGIKHYIRYIFDYDEYMEDGYTQGDYFNRTAGKVCHNFSELLEAIDTYQERDDTAEYNRIHDKLWEYAGGKDDFEKTIQQVMDFKVVPREFPTLYSFDIFDTLISRKVLDPMGIFALVRDHMVEHRGFPQALVQKYPEIRHSAELNVREYYQKSTELRKSDRVEISFDEIFSRIADVYRLSDEQANLLKQWELDEELNNVIPLTEQIDLIKQLKSRGETVVLICDMYLPKEIILQMLKKADPVLPELPLFLSNEYGVLKTSQKLFFEVYKSFEPYYDFEKWIHYGDNPGADVTSARKFKISTRQVSKPEFNDIQQQLVRYMGTGDSYLVAALQARMCAETSFKKDEFVISYVALTMVPYVDWALRDAVSRGYKMLYFVSRDGYHLKRIADEIIRVRGLDLKTKYIYASRRTWRIPSYIDHVDEGFWLGYGNLVDLTSKEKMFEAMDLDEETFRRLFPTIDPDTIDFSDKKTFKSIRDIFRDSKPYNDYLLETAAKERVLVEGYLKQEMNFDEPFAFVEYYGRGYNQDCLVNLLRDITGKEMPVPFYYMRTVLPTMGDSIRHHFTTNATTPYFMEGIFANMPYKSIEEYKHQEDGTIVPVITPIEYDKELYDSMNRILPEFAARFAALELRHPEDTDRVLHEFAFNYYTENLTNPTFAENIGTNKDSVSLYGTKREFAPPYTEENLEQFANKELGRGSGFITTSISMSVTRSSKEIQDKYFEMYQILPGDDVASGRVLSEKEIENNRKFKKKYEDLLSEAEVYKQEYDQAVHLNSVQNKAVIVVAGKDYGNSGLDLVEAALQEQGKLKTSTISIKKLKDKPEIIAEELATAKFVIVSAPIAQFCKIQYRPETKEIMLNSIAFYLYHDGLTFNHFLKWQTQYKRMAAQNDISVLQIPSQKLEERYRQDYSDNANTDCSLRGNCNTDVYFQDNAASEAKHKLLELFPEAKGKKILLYMPTVRRRKNCHEWLDILNMEILHELIGNEYAVVVNFNLSQLKDAYYNTIEIPGFSKMLNNGISLRQLMMAADVLVGDYRDTFYESSLLHKPTYFTVNDREEIIKSRNFAVPKEFEAYIFGPIVATAQDLAEELSQSEAYDYTAMEQFRQEMLTECDGHSVERVVKYLEEG